MGEKLAMMKITFCVMVLGVSLVGCMSSERDMPATCRVIKEVKPTDADEDVIDTSMVVRYFRVGHLLADQYVDRQVCLKEQSSVEESEVIPRETLDDRKWKEWFAVGCEATWPVGSSCTYIPLLAKIRVRNTADNLKLIDAFMAELDSEREMLEVQVRFVKVGQKTLDDVGAELLPGKGVGHRYDLSDFDAVSAEKLERCLVARRDLLGNDASKVLASSGKEGEVKSVTEFLYPQDYDVNIGEMTSCGSNANVQVRTFGVVAAEPQNFTMREVGMIVRATPSLMDDGKHVEVVLRAEVVESPVWKEYGSRLPAPDGGDYALPITQPIFPLRSVESRYKGALGEVQLIGARVGAAGSDVTELVFLRVRKTGACGSEVKQQ